MLRSFSQAPAFVKMRNEAYLKQAKCHEKTPDCYAIKQRKNKWVLYYKGRIILRDATKTECKESALKHFKGEAYFPLLEAPHPYMIQKNKNSYYLYRTHGPNRVFLMKNVLKSALLIHVEMLLSMKKDE